MHLFEILIKNITDKYGRIYSNSLVNINTNIINIDKINDFNFLAKIEKKVLGIISIAASFEDNNILAIGFYLLGCFFHKKAQKNHTKLFSKTMIRSENYDEYLRAIYLYNACWCACKNIITIEDKELFKFIRDVQKNLIADFLRWVGDVGLTEKIINEIEILENDLKIRREEINREINSDNDVFLFFGKNTNLYKEKITRLVDLCLSAIKNNNEIDYVILGLGSLSRKEITPYSDIEFIVLINSGVNQFEDTVTFTTAIQLMNLAVICLNESLIPLDLYEDTLLKTKLYQQKQKIRRGFAFDGAGRTALGKRFVRDNATYYKFKLLGDIEHVLKYMRATKYLDDYKAQSEFGQFIVLDEVKSQHDLVKQYRDKLIDYIRREKSMLTNLMLDNQVMFSFEQVTSNASKSPNLNVSNNNEIATSEDDLSILVKHHIYRPLERCIDALWLTQADNTIIYDSSSVEKLEYLASKNVIDQSFKDQVIKILKKILKLRLCVYSYYQVQKEDLIIPGSYSKNKKIDFNLLTEKHFLTENELGGILVFVYQFYEKVKAYVKASDIEVINRKLKKEKKYANFMEMGDAFFVEKKYLDALHCYEYQIKLNNNSYEKCIIKIIECRLLDLDKDSLYKIDSINLNITEAEKIIHESNDRIEVEIKAKCNIYLAICKIWLQKNEGVFFDFSEIILKHITDAIEVYFKINKIYTINYKNGNFTINPNIKCTGITLSLFLYSMYCHFCKDKDKDKGTYATLFLRKALLSYNNLDGTAKSFVELFLKASECIEISIKEVKCDEAVCEFFFKENKKIAKVEPDFKGQDDLYGRERESDIEKLEYLLNTKPMVQIYGEAAVGKTTLVRYVVGRSFSSAHKIIWLNASDKNTLMGSYASVSLESDYIGTATVNTVEDITKKVFETLLIKSKEKPFIIIYDNVEEIETIKSLMPLGGQTILNYNVLNRFIIISQVEHQGYLYSLHVERIKPYNGMVNLVKASRGISLCYSLIKKNQILDNITDKEIPSFIEKNDINFIEEIIKFFYCKLDPEQQKNLVMLSMLNIDYIESEMFDYFYPDDKNRKECALIARGFVEHHTKNLDSYYTVHSRIKIFLLKPQVKNNLSMLVKDLVEKLFDYYCKERGKFKQGLNLIPHFSVLTNYIKNNLDLIGDNDVINSYSLIISMHNMLSHAIYSCNPSDILCLEKSLHMVEKDLAKMFLLREKFIDELNQEKILDKDFPVRLRKIRLLLRAIGFAYLNKNNLDLARIYLHEALLITKLLLYFERKIYPVYKNEEGAGILELANYRLAIAYRDLAEVLLHAGLYQRALIYAKKSWDQFEKSDLRKGKPYVSEISIAMAIVGLCHYNLGHYEFARLILEKSLDKKRSVFGEEKNDSLEKMHVEIAISESNLALALCAVGEVSRAEQYLENTQSYFLKKFGEESRRYITTVERLAFVYFTLASNSASDIRAKYLKKAYATCIEAIDLYRRYHKNSPNFIKVLLLFSEIILLGFFCKENILNGRNEENTLNKEKEGESERLMNEDEAKIKKSFNCLQEAYSIVKANKIKYHYVAFYFPENLFFPVDISKLTENISAYKEPFIKLLFITKKIYGESHPLVARRYYDLGQIYYFSKKEIKAIKFFREAYNLLVKNNLHYENIFSESVWEILVSNEKNSNSSAFNFNNIFINEISSENFISSDTLGQSGCFFDSLALRLNQINRTDLYSSFQLRGLCYAFYLENSDLVRQLDLRSWDKIDKENNYYFSTSSTQQKCQDKFSALGRPHVEGVMLCNQLNLKGFCIVNILEEAETSQKIVNFNLILRDGCKKIGALEAQAWINNSHIATLIFDQKKDYFHPLLLSKKSLLLSPEDVLYRLSKCKKFTKKELLEYEVAVLNIEDIDTKYFAQHNFLLEKLGEFRLKESDYYKAILYFQRNIAIIINRNNFFSDENAIKNDFFKAIKNIGDVWQQLGYNYHAFLYHYILGKGDWHKACHFDNFQCDQSHLNEIKRSLANGIHDVDKYSRAIDLLESIAIEDITIKYDLLIAKIDLKGRNLAELCKDLTALSCVKIEASGNPFLQLRIRSNLSNMLYLQENVTSAINEQNEVLRDFAKLKNIKSPRHAIFLTRMAKFYYSNKQYELAEKYSIYALAVFRMKYTSSVLQHPSLLNVYLIFGLVCLSLNKTTLAYYYLNQAHALGFFRYEYNLPEVIKLRINNIDFVKIDSLYKVLKNFSIKILLNKLFKFDKENEAMIVVEKKCNANLVYKKIIEIEVDHGCPYQERTIGKLVQLARDLNFKLDAVGVEGRTLFYELCRYGDIDLLNDIKNYLDNEFVLKDMINKETKVGWRAIILAAEMNNIEVVKWLLENGADVNTYSFKKKYKIEIEEEGIFFEYEGYSDTPLYFAVKFQNLEMVKLLLNHRANLDWHLNEGVNIFQVCLMNFMEKKELKSKSHEIINKEILDYLFLNTSEEQLVNLYTSYYGRFYRTLFHELIDKNIVTKIEELFDNILDIESQKKYKIYGINLFEKASYGRYVIQLARTSEMRNIILNEYVSLMKDGENIQKLIVTNKYFDDLLNGKYNLAFDKWVSVFYDLSKKDFMLMCSSSQWQLDEDFENKFIINHLLRLSLTINEPACFEIVKAILNNEEYVKEIEFDNKFYGYNPFYEAAYGGNLNSMNILLDTYKKLTCSDYNLCFINSNEWTPVIVVILRDYNNSHKEMFDFLMGKKPGDNLCVRYLNTAYLDQETKSHETALYIAIRRNKVYFSKELISKGASLVSVLNPKYYQGFMFFKQYKKNEQDEAENKKSALHLAARQGNKEILDEIFGKLDPKLLEYPYGRFKYTVLHEAILSENIFSNGFCQQIILHLDTLEVSTHSRDIYDLILHNPTVGRCVDTSSRFAKAQEIYGKLCPTEKMSLVLDKKLN